jgi:hypothetical protein
MMFAVEWTDDGLAALALGWTQAPDRQAVTAAQSRIDHFLASDPWGNSVAVSEGLYAIEEYPLRAQFEIDQARRVVTVGSVGHLP